MYDLKELKTNQETLEPIKKKDNFSAFKEKSITAQPFKQRRIATIMLIALVTTLAVIAIWLTITYMPDNLILRELLAASFIIACLLILSALDRLPGDSNIN